jgi:hypothetical protein
MKYLPRMMFGMSVVLLQLADPVKAEEIDVFFVAGQSNAAGVAKIANFNTDPGGVVPAGYSLSNANVMLYTSGSSAWGTLAPQNATNFGPEIAMGNRLAQLYPDRQIAIIKHAVGATSLHTDWNPSSTTPGTQWTTFVNTAHDALQAVIDAGDTPMIRGMAWQQGERDANPAGATQAQADAYGQNLRDLILSVRSEFGAPDMEFVYGRVLQNIDSYAYEDKIRAGQDAVDKDAVGTLATEGATLISSDDLTSNYNNDLIHLDYVDQLQLGERFANEFSVPEPGSLSLIAIGGYVLLRRRRA